MRDRKIIRKKKMNLLILPFIVRILHYMNGLQYQCFIELMLFYSNTISIKTGGSKNFSHWARFQDVGETVYAKIIELNYNNIIHLKFYTM